jgi:trans-2,3-dihydro-3-hydroxyanthranilate isomerase
MANPRSAGSGITVVHTRVFAAGPGGGNPCPVVPRAADLSDAAMLALARHFGLDTVFLLPPRDPAADLRLRFFVPAHEMGVSGHATVAAITVAAREGLIRAARLTVETSTGLFTAECAGAPEAMTVTLAQRAPVFGAVAPPALVAPALRIPGAAVTGAAQVVSVSRPKLLVPLADAGVLDAVRPDVPALESLCDAFGASGVYAFARPAAKEGADAEARQFPLRAGIPEDAATGVAAAALAAYLAVRDRACRPGRHVFRIAQGYAMGAPSLILATADCAGGAVAGTAVSGSAAIAGSTQLAADFANWRQP